MKAESFALILGVLASPPLSVAVTSSKDIVDTATATDRFKMLSTAIQAAGLDDTLKGLGPYTIFAPTDDAFKKLSLGTMEILLKPENKERLKAILLTHVVSGSVVVAQAREMASVKAVNGQDLAIASSGTTLMINDAKVVNSDVRASNGVIHVVDTVLLPKN